VDADDHGMSGADRGDGWDCGLRDNGDRDAEKDSDGGTSDHRSPLIDHLDAELPHHIWLAAGALARRGRERQVVGWRH